MAETEQINDQELFSSTDTPKVANTQGQFNPNVSFEQTLKTNFPEYAGYNSFYIRQQLNKDQEFFDEVSNKLFLSGLTDQQFEILRDDREKLSQAKNQYKQGFRKFVTGLSYSGEAMEDTLVNRTLDVTSDVKQIPTNDYISTVTSDPKKYKEFGLVNDEGDFLYADNYSAFNLEVLSNQDLHRSIQKDRFSNFQEILGRDYNQVASLDNPAEQTKAFIIFDKLGKEAMTEYINAIQTIQEGSLLDSAEKAKEARQYLKNVKIGDKSLNEYYEEFVVGTVKDTPYGDKISKYSYRYNVDPALASAIMETESSFNPEAVSPTGNVGLYQLGPDTSAVDVGLSPDELTDPEKNIRGGLEYWSKLQERYEGDLDKQLAAWNAGMGNVDKAVEKARNEGGTWKDYLPKPEETLPFIDKVKERRGKYEEKTDRGLVFNPITPNKELQKDVPKDLNGFSIGVYNKDGSLKPKQEYANTFVEQNFPSVYKDGFDIDDPEDYARLTKQAYSKATRDQGFNVEDLISTVVAGSVYTREDENGNPVYGLNYNNMNWMQKTAFDALLNDSEFKYNVEDLGDGTFNYKPARRQLSSSRWRDSTNWMFNTKKQYVDGEFIEVADDGFMAGVQNSLATLLVGGAGTAMRYVLSPMAKGFEKFSDATGYGSDFSRQAIEVTKELAGIDPSAELTTSDEHGAFVAGVGEVAPFFWYLAGMATLGRFGLGVGASSLSTLTRSKQALDAIRLGKAMKGSVKFAKQADKLRKGVATNAPWTLGANFMVGGATLEALSPEEHSFYNVIPEAFGLDPTNSVTSFYNQANDVTQIGMDIAGSLILDIFADTVITGGRFGVESIQRMFGKDKFKGLMFDSTEGVFKTQDTPALKSEFNEFYHNLTRGLADAEYGNVGDALTKSMTRGVKTDTIHDHVKKFTDKGSDIASNIKNEIRNNIKFIETKLAHRTEKRLTEEQINELVENNYTRFIDGTATTLSNVLKTSEDDSLVLRWAQAMEEQVPTLKEFKLSGDRVPVEEAGYWKQKGYNLIVKNDRIYEVDDKFWAVDVASKMREEFFNVNKEFVLDRKFRQAGIDINKRKGIEATKAKEITEQVDEIIGTPIQAGGKLGYVVDFDDTGYTVRTADGDVKVSKMTNLEEGYLTNFQIENRLDELQRKQEVFRRTQQGMKQLSDIESGIPEKEFVSEGTILFRQIESPFEGSSVSGINTSRRKAIASNSEIQPETINDLIGRNVVYGDYEGMLKRDVEGNIVVDTGDTLAEVPVTKRGETKLSQVGIVPKYSYDSASESVILNGKIYRHKNDLTGFKFGKDGPSEVVLKNVNGKDVKFTDKNIVEELYNQRILQKNISNPIQNKVISQVRLNNLDNVVKTKNKKLLELADKVREINSKQTKIPFC